MSRNAVLNEIRRPAFRGDSRALGHGRQLGQRDAWIDWQAWAKVANPQSVPASTRSWAHDAGQQFQPFGR
jgi:hypothetical protein